MILGRRYPLIKDARLHVFFYSRLNNIRMYPSRGGSYAGTLRPGYTRRRSVHKDYVTTYNGLQANASA